MNHRRVLQSLILSTPACDSFVETGDDQAVADILSVGRVRIVPTEIGVGTILATLGPNGGAFLDGLVSMGETDRNTHWAMDLVKQGKFDIGMAGTRSQMRSIAESNPVIAPMFEALLALAEVPDPYTPEQVSIALRGPWGDVILEEPIIINAEESASDAVKLSESQA
jgi:hypothetical protein